MDYYQLKSFVAVANEGSITRASESLFLSQPAISAHLKSIEELVGLPLFERTSSGMLLTKQGARLLPKAQHALRAHASFLEEAKQIKNCLSGSLTIAVSPTIRSRLLGNLIYKLAEQYPDLKVEAKRYPASEIRSGLRNQFFDVAFYNEYDSPSSEQFIKLINHFSVSLATPIGMLTEQQAKDWKYLETLPWILPAENTCCGQHAERLFNEQDIRPNTLIRIDDEKVVLALISQGVGIGLVHDDLQDKSEYQGKFDLIYTVNESVPVYFTCLKSRTKEPAIQAAVKLIQDHSVT